MSLNSGSSFSFEYDNNKRLTKKIGGFVDPGSGSGYDTHFSDKIYTSLNYNNNNVTVEDYSSSANFNVPKNSKYFVLNSNNQITKKEVPFISNRNLDEIQTFTYLNSKLTEIKTTFPNLSYYPPNDYIPTYLEKFYYDSKGNLTKSEYILQKDGVNTSEKTVRTFEDYDNSYNAWKRLYLLDDFFYRSISKNNFRKYTEIKYDIAGNITSSKEQTLNFNYDSSGNIVIN